jgi:anti-sigma B factor antagonist
MLPVPEIRGRWRLTAVRSVITFVSISSIQHPARPAALTSKSAVIARGVAFAPPARRRASRTPELYCVGRRRVLSSQREFIWSVSMQIAERAIGDVMVLDLKGKITLGEGDELLKDKVNSLVNQGHKKIILNLADVPYIDSAGLGEVVRTYTTVSRQGGSLKLLNLTKRITDLLSITKLLTVFETFESETEAVRSFSASAKV